MIDADPLFADQAGSDYHLTWNSPCRNSGSNAAVPLGLTADREGNPRIVLGIVDMGADEFWFHLYHSGDVVPGGTIALNIVGGPGMAPVMLAVGSGIQNPPQGTPYGNLYLLLPAAVLIKLGAVPSNGILAHSATVPAVWMPGDEKPLQALVGSLSSPRARLTNLLILTIE
jgi:hypothetical protein